MIPGVTYHPRETWQSPLQPVTGPKDNETNNDTVVIHYTAADNLIDGDPGEHASNLPAYMRAMQNAYVTQRGYSLGYSFAVDWLGGVWQLRGWNYQSAANAGHNDHTLPILMLVDGQDPATPEAVVAVQKIVAEAQKRFNRPTLKIVGHGQLSGAATQCPGVGLRAQIQAGVFVPKEEGDEMKAVQPVRLFDGRVNGQTPVLVPCSHNGTVFVNVTVADGLPGGWVSSGADTNSNSVVNMQSSPNSTGVPVGSLGGFYLTATHPCRLVVDLFGVV